MIESRSATTATSSLSTRGCIPPGPMDLQASRLSWQQSCRSELSLLRLASAVGTVQRCCRAARGEALLSRAGIRSVAWLSDYTFYSALQAADVARAREFSPPTSPIGMAAVPPAWPFLPRLEQLKTRLCL